MPAITADLGSAIVDADSHSTASTSSEHIAEDDVEAVSEVSSEGNSIDPLAQEFEDPDLSPASSSPPTSSREVLERFLAECSESMRAESRSTADSTDGRAPALDAGELQPSNDMLHFLAMFDNE